MCEKTYVFLIRFFKHITHFSFTLFKWPQKPSNYNCELVTGVDKLRVRVLAALKTSRAEELIQVKSVGARNPPIGRVWKFEEGEKFQLRSRSLHFTAAQNYDIYCQ
ncbi:hypothetical protein TNCV_813611 [Trichonephila clavipes]|nr:hypothetical protein TNCV_813611 [Trichonephila clavipes]